MQRITEVTLSQAELSDLVMRKVRRHDKEPKYAADGTPNSRMVDEPIIIFQNYDGRRLDIKEVEVVEITYTEELIR